MAHSGEKVLKTFKALWDGFWVVWLAQVFWLLLCLPVVTFPLAFTGMYSATYAAATGESTTWKTFFEGIKKNFKPGVTWSLVNLLVCAVLGFYLWFVSSQSSLFESTTARVLQVILIAVLIFWFLLNQYTFPFLLAQEKPSYRQALRNSLVLFLKWPGMSFAFSVLILCVLALSLAFRFFWVIFAVSLPAFLAASCVKYAVEEIPGVSDQQSNE
jgi:hypothetical protein